MMLKKLNTFIIKDSFNRTLDQINEEALNSAHRQAAILGWTDLSIARTTKSDYMESDYRCYEYDIFGKELESLGTQNDSLKNTSHILKGKRMYKDGY